MLRILVMVLAAANVLFFAWSHWAAEQKPVLTAVASAGDAGKRKKSAAPEAPPPCATLGPFHDESLAEQAEQRLIQSGLRPQRRATSEDVHDGWWVAVANADATRQARTLDAIRRSGLRDAFAMTDDTEFRVSVGLFSEQARAEERAKRVQRLNLDAVVVERHRQQPVIWFDLAGMARETLADGRLESTGLPLDVLRIEVCPAPGAEDAADPESGTGTGNAAPAGEEDEGVAGRFHARDDAAARV